MALYANVPVFHDVLLPELKTDITFEEVEVLVFPFQPHQVKTAIKRIKAGSLKMLWLFTVIKNYRGKRYGVLDTRDLPHNVLTRIVQYDVGCINFQKPLLFEARRQLAHDIVLKSLNRPPYVWEAFAGFSKGVFDEVDHRLATDPLRKATVNSGHQTENGN